jgi:hypothetical protein
MRFALCSTFFAPCLLRLALCKLRRAIRLRLNKLGNILNRTEVFRQKIVVRHSDAELVLYKSHNLQNPERVDETVFQKGFINAYPLRRRKLLYEKLSNTITNEFVFQMNLLELLTADS